MVIAFKLVYLTAKTTKQEEAINSLKNTLAIESIHAEDLLTLLLGEKAYVAYLEESL